MSAKPGRLPVLTVADDEILLEPRLRYSGVPIDRPLKGIFLPVTVQHGQDAPDGHWSITIGKTRYSARGHCRECSSGGRQQ
jgi:hypothetical protein